jgi:ubiquinone/menaquinone biosynthesis C-methylase UbiE
MDHLLDLTHQAEANHAWFRGFRRFVEPVLTRAAAERPRVSILDCGCGTGANLDMARRQTHASTTIGFDLSPGGLATARARGLRVARADITRIPLRADRFDIVTSFDVLQCVAEDASAVREMARVMRPGGALVLTLAAFDFLGGDHGEVWGEVRRYTPASARRLVAQAGLTVERVSFLFASLFPIVLTMRLAQRLTRPFRQVSEASDIRVPPAPVNSVLTALVTCEAWLARYLPMPVGSSLLVVARKASEAHDGAEVRPLHL